MKIIDTLTFEKLKIRPVNVADLKNHIEYKKSILQTFDIVKMCEKYYMTFLREDIITYNDEKVNIKYIPMEEHLEGIFVSYNKTYNELRYMYIDGYDDDLKRTYGSDCWDVSEIWRCSPNRVFQFWNVRTFELNDLTQAKLIKMLVEYNYTMIQ